MRLKLTLRYDGTHFHGWQVQKNAVTVQKVLGDAFLSLLGFRPDLTGCSRTDTGVHAREFVCHSDMDPTIPLDKLPLALNRYLPKGVALTSAERVAEEFHARYSVKTKTYRYYILPSSVRDPLRADRVLFWPKPLKEDRFCLLAPDFAGKHDFSAFMAAGSKITDPVRTVTDCRAFREGDCLCLEITADGFLYHMVRIIVGTLLSLSSGSEGRSIAEIIAQTIPDKKISFKSISTVNSTCKYK